MTTVAVPRVMVDCRFCGRRHGSHARVAKCRYPNAHRVDLGSADERGNAPFASVSYCHQFAEYTRGPIVMIWATRGDARNALLFIERAGCGSCCIGHHKFIRL